MELRYPVATQNLRTGQILHDNPAAHLANGTKGHRGADPMGSTWPPSSASPFYSLPARDGSRADAYLFNGVIPGR